MISIDEALRRVLAESHERPGVTRPVSDVHGCVLARDVPCTGDSPPHDKALVDGYALRAADVSSRGTELRILEEVTAGVVPRETVVSGTATRIMTGAPLPSGADAVVMIERTEPVADASPWGHVRINDHPLRTGQNLMRRGEVMRRGEPVLRRGHRLRAIEVGLLAELGIPEVDVVSPPRVGVLSTGNELVSPEETPSAGQIRNSNGPLLEQLVREAGCEVRQLGIARDNEADLVRAVRAGLEADVLMASGGVSAGVLDLVPQVFRQLGVMEVFHKVRLKPGKPMWFGVLADGQRGNKLVFGLPGNPVGGLVCFYLFVRPTLARLCGETADDVPRIPVVLAADFQHRGDRPTYHPGRTREREGELFVEPLKWRGSADLRTLADADVLIQFPAGDQLFRAGERVWAHRL
jgi:molybdopterin molybdotransferase